MKLASFAALLAVGLALAGCLESDHPPPGSDLSAQVKAPLDKAAAVNQAIDAQDAAQRKAMDDMGR